MPTILRLHLIPQEDILLRLENGPAHGWFLALAAQCDTAWADALHRSGERHPYALSPFHHPNQIPLASSDSLEMARLASGRVRRGEPLSLRLSFADDTQAQYLLSALPDLSLPPLQGVPCRLARHPQFTENDPECLFASWAALADAPPAERLLVAFETPTAFSHQGESLVLPEPERLLESWRRAWQCAPAQPLGADEVTSDSLRITRYALRTERLSLKGGLRIGFVGTLELTWRRGTSPRTRRAFAALAGLADFLGTGAKTAMGMGQTRIRVAEDA